MALKLPQILKPIRNEHGDLDGTAITQNVVVSAVGGVVALTLLANTVFFVEETDRGLLYTAGALTTTDTSGLLRPGVHVKLPFIQNATMLPFSVERLEFEGVETYTRNNQVITATIGVGVRIPEAQMVNIARLHPDWQNKVRDAVLDSFKTTMGQHEAEVIAASREAIMASVVQDAQRRIADLYGIEVTTIQMTNFDFSDEFEGRIEGAAEAVALQTRARTELETSRVSAERTVVDANAAAQRTGIEAAAEANRITTVREAEAEGLDRLQRTIGRENIDEYLFSQRWNGQLPQATGGAAIVDMRGVAAAARPAPQR